MSRGAISLAGGADSVDVIATSVSTSYTWQYEEEEPGPPRVDVFDGDAGVERLSLVTPQEADALIEALTEARETVWGRKED